MSALQRVPPYFDYLIEGFRSGAAGRHVHLGYWADGRHAFPVQGHDDPAFARAQRRLDDRLVELASLTDGMAVLDAGCGFGGTLEQVNATYRRMSLCGVNVDPRQLAICETLVPVAGNTLEWREGDACSLPCADASFDRVLCVEAMFHFASRRDFFVEAARVLKPGGALVGSDVLVTPDARQHESESFPIEAALDEGYGPWPDLWGTDADHAALARTAGLLPAAMHDVTANVLPSHRFTTPDGADVRQPTRNTALRAALMLRWLHEQGHLRYLCFRFDKPLDAQRSQSNNAAIRA